MLYQNLPDYRNKVRPQPLNVSRRPYVAAAYQEPSSKRLRIPKWPLAGVFAVALFVFVALHSYSAPPSIAHAFTALTATSKEKDAAARQVRLEAYKVNVGSLIAAHPDENIAVASVDMSDNNAMLVGDTGTFTAASTAKLITAVVLLHEVEQGKLTLNTYIDGQTARSLLSNMIINSDNDAWQSLNDYLTHDTLQAYTAGLGWKDYDPDVNTLLPVDMATLAQKLYEDQLLNASDTDLLLSLMRQANKQEYIVDSVHSLRPDLTVYHKAGWLDGLMHDVAIISDGKHSIVLAIYSYDSDSQGDGPANQQLFKQITGAALAAYFPESK